MKIYAPGTRIDRYEVAGRPLMGGMGIVYLCHDLQEDRPVALKTFKPEFLPDRSARDRFLREGTHWVDLGQHPHVVRCYRVVRIGDGREVYLALELVAKEPGRDDASLRAWLTPGQPLPLEQALLFALQVARGMGHAAATLPGFVHRDLKPENVLVGADKVSGVNRLRVTDFGLAAVLQGMDLQTSEVFETSEVSDALRHLQLTHGIVGTPLYMAPEQWRGERVTIATDVYALGCILYEMVAGQPAIAGGSLQALELPEHASEAVDEAMARYLAALRRAHCAGDLRPLPPDLPGPLHALLMRCLAVEPRERYKDWAQVEAALVSAYETLAGRPAPEAAAAVYLSREERVAAGWSYNAMGLSYRDIGKAEVAAGYFERAKSVGSAEGERALEGAALGNLGSAYLQLGDARRAIVYCEQALTIGREICATSQSAAERTAARRGEGNDLGNLGNAYSQLGDARRAIGYYEQCLTIHREIRDRHGEGTVLGNLGIAYKNLGDVRRAIGYYEQALAVTREVGDRRGEGNALGNLGIACLQLGDVRRAIGYHEQALAIAREIGDRHGEGNALNNLGNAYLQLGDARRVIGYYEQALAIAREIGDRRDEGNALGSLGIAYKNLGDTRRAIGYYEQCLTIHREIGDEHGEGTVLSNMGEAYRSLGDARRAIGYYERALSIDREIGERRGEGADLGNLGTAYLELGDARRAIGYYEQCLTIHREIGERRGEGSALGNLGIAYSDLGDARRAIGYYEQQLVITREIRDQRGEGNALVGLGNAYARLGDAQRAIEYYEQALTIHREIGDRRGEGNALGNLGNAYSQLGDARRAIGYYEQQLTITHEIGDMAGAAMGSYNMAILYAQQGEAARALELAHEAARIWSQIGHAQYAQRAQGLIARLQGDGTPSSGPSPDQILQQFAPVIEAVVAAAHGHRQARAEVEGAFEQMEKGGWRIVAPIQRIWAGERDAGALTAGLDDTDSLIVREILKQLES